MIYHGDLFDVLPTLEAESIDACVTDPPYGIGFMSKAWDTFKPGEAEKRLKPCEPIQSDNPNLKGRKRAPASSPSAVEYDRSLKGQHEFQAWTEAWAREVLRVLKPGAYLVVCGAPRSYHRMASGLEDAGFEIRDCLCWLFGQGFPKSLDVSKAIDKAAGAEREVVGPPKYTRGRASQAYSETRRVSYDYPAQPVTTPATEAAARWAGWGTALKPAYEPVVLARKPLIGTVAENVLTHGTGAINIDKCRIDSGESTTRPNCSQMFSKGGIRDDNGRPANNRSSTGSDLGRWPANVLLDEEAAVMLDEASAERIHSAGAARDNFCPTGDSSWYTSNDGTPRNGRRFGDDGGASRFFLVAGSDCILCGVSSARHGIMSECKTTSASDAERRSATIHRIIASTALNPAHASLAERLAQVAPSVESLCERCATSIVLALAVIKSSGSHEQASRVFQGSTLDSRSSILIPSLASFAELWGSIGTIPTTASLSLLFGSVLHAIDGCARKASAEGLANTESGPTRFLYSPKPSREERDHGIYDLSERVADAYAEHRGRRMDEPSRFDGKPVARARNHHPTVKPIELMRWLVKLVTPPNGKVLDPFAGSGTTGMACAYEFREFIGIEREAEYVEIAKRRIANCAPLFTETSQP